MNSSLREHHKCQQRKTLQPFPTIAGFHIRIQSEIPVSVSHLDHGISAAMPFDQIVEFPRIGCVQANAAM